MTLTHTFIRTGQTTRILPDTLHFMDGFRDSSDVAGGYASATGSISSVEYAAHTALYQMGTTWLVKDTVSGNYIWAGNLNDPEITEDGVCMLTADGWGKMADTQVAHFLLMSYDMSAWLLGNQDPLSYVQSEKFNVKVGGNRIAWKIQKHTHFHRNDAGNPSDWSAGAYRWTPGNDIRYISFDIIKTHNDPDYKMQVVKGNGPAGALTIVQTYDMDGTAPASVALSITAGSDMVGVRIMRTQAADHAIHRSFEARNIHIGSIYQQESITLNEAFTALFNKMTAIGTQSVAASAQNIVPYEADHGTLGQIADELSLLANWHWRVDAASDGTKIGYAGPLGAKSWQLQRTHSPVHLLPQPRFSSVRYPYRSSAGIDYTDIYTTTGIVPAGYERVYDLQFDEPAHHAVMALVAQRVAEYLAVLRHSGRASFTKVWNTSGAVEVQGTEVKPGDEIILTNQSSKSTIVSGVEHEGDGAITTVALADGQPMLDRWLAKHKQLLNKGMGADRAAFAILGNDIPKTPTGVAVDYRIKEVDNKLHYRAVVTWSPVTEDIDSNGTYISRYEVQMRPVNAGGVWLNEDGSVVTGTNAGYRLRHSVKTSLSTDTPLSSDTKETFDEIMHPKNWYWQARVRAIDLSGQMSAWSAWTTQTLPFATAEPKPPTPTGVTLTFDTIEKDRWTRISATTNFNEVTNFQYPGDAAPAEDEVASYGIQLQKSADGSTAGPIRHHVKIAKDADADTTSSFRWDRVRKRYWYRTRIRSIDKFNRKSDWSAWTSYAIPSDTTAPPIPINLVAKGVQDEVNVDWDDPQDPLDSELVDPDVAYYQIRLTSGALPSDTLLKVWKMRVATRVNYSTVAYKKRYWFHVRTVDSSGNKSAWVSIGPVRPSRISGTRDIVTGIVTGVDWSLSMQDQDVVTPGQMLAGGGANSAYPVTVTGAAIAIAEGEDNEGTAELTFTTAELVAKTVLGVAMRAVDVNNFVGVLWDDVAGQIKIEKWTAGTPSSLTTYTIPASVLGEDTTHALKIDLTGNTYNVYLDSVLVKTLTDASYSTSTKHGFYIRRSASLDSGQSRIHRFRFTALDPLMGVVIDDEFDRTTSSPTQAVGGWTGMVGAPLSMPGAIVPGTNSAGTPSTGGGGIGTATSGQVYTTLGSWGIEPTDTPFAIYGASVALPIYFAEAPEIYYEFVKSYTVSEPPTIFGLAGKDTTGLLIEIDRPTRFIVHGETNVQNDDVDDHIIRFHVMAREYPSTSWVWSRQKNIWSNALDAGNVQTGEVPQIAKQRGGSSSGVFYFNATPEAPKIIELVWGYTIGDASTGAWCAVRNMVMTVTAAYSPDYSASFSTTKRAHWTRSKVTRKAYRTGVTSPTGAEQNN